MKKWKAILFGTLLTLSLCTITACGTEVNNADETVDEKNKDEKDKKKDTIICIFNQYILLSSLT